MNKELDEKLVAIRQKAAQEVPQEATNNSVEPTEESSKPVAEETPTEQPEAQEQPVVEETPAPEKPWYDDEAPEESKVELDFSSLGSALQLGDVKTKDEFVAKVTELKSKLKQSENDALSTVPDEFKEVIKATKSGADWKEMLANQLIDFSKVDPIKLYEDEFLKDNLNNPAYFTDGKFDEDKALEDFDAQPTAVKQQVGKQIQQALVFSQKQRKAELKAQAEAKVIAAEKSLSTATKKLNELLPVEKYGFPIDGNLQNSLYQGIVNSKLTKKHLGVDYETLVKSGADMNAIARSITLSEYGEKMLMKKGQTSKAEAKKEILTKTSNTQIKTPGSRVNPDAEEKILSPAEKLRIFQQSNKVGL